MKGILIAAGMSTRLRPFTDDWPKCMLKLNGKPMIQNTLDIFTSQGITDVAVIKGYKKEKINLPNLTYFENDDFQNNNILHSLMYARDFLQKAADENQDVIISYADIQYDESVVEKLKQSQEAITAVVDLEWMPYYEGRTDHPVSEAENAVLHENSVRLIGKHITPDEHEQLGEFLGLWKLSPEGIKMFLEHFDRLNNTLEKTQPFQRAKEWQKSYITDFFQELVNQGLKVSAVTIKGGWKEIDTVQDYLRAGGEPQ